MAVAVPTETLDRTWSPVLDDVRAAELDCLQANLAAVADRRHGPGSHLALGAWLRFASTGEPGGPPSVEVPLQQRLTEAEELLGLAVAKRWDGVDGPTLRALVAEHGPLYVVGDAHDMSWLPYFGRSHMEHSLLLADACDSCTVVDAYHNDTPWGSARPGVWRLSPTEFDAAVPTATAILLSEGPLPAVDPVGVLVGNARALANRAPADRYVTAVREHLGDPAALDRLVLDVWLLSRSRQLHASWLAEAPAAPADGWQLASAHADAWQAMSTQVYVAMRRAQRGGGVPTGLADRLRDLLDGDVALASALAALAVRASVVDALAAVLKLDPATAASAGVLRDLPNFNSFRLIDVIEHVEAQLGVVLDPDQLTATGLRDVEALSGMFRLAVEREDTP
ncbi:acyl carrier protein [Solihabitans fulvus]|uniref:Acyl carrier protein n=1 Tax=Solihabitans fulvus TaxID=1892852 RepID=A0A5B2WUZ0_9PSEU|nr:acyl carrier protein [Solihabitans fulvus]KAA2255365.1 acyl carrier protein [Solihabitans fulvus]